MHYQPKQDLLQNRIILVTGASDGIGREAALTYARYGATVILLGRNEEKLRRVAQHIADEQHVQPQWFTLDLLTCTAEECRQMADRIAAHYPRLDGVLHNAGLLGEIGPMSEQDPQIWQDVMQCHLYAHPGAVTVIAEVRCWLAGLYVIKRWPSGTRQLGRLCHLEVCY